MIGFDVWKYALKKKKKIKHNREDSSKNEES